MEWGLLSSQQSQNRVHPRKGSERYLQYLHYCKFESEIAVLCGAFRAYPKNNTLLEFDINSHQIPIIAV